MQFEIQIRYSMTSEVQLDFFFGGGGGGEDVLIKEGWQWRHGEESASRSAAKARLHVIVEAEWRLERWGTTR